jgi:hypothetical protein
MQEAADGFEEDFQATTATWKHWVKFEKTVDLGDPLRAAVYTDDEIYRYVNDGTEPHPIFAGIYTGKSNKRALAFPGTFSAKTAPRVIGSGAGASGGKTSVVPYVNHPGTEAREFDAVIQEKWTPRFKNTMEKALRDGARATGYS